MLKGIGVGLDVSQGAVPAGGGSLASIKRVGLFPADSTFGTGVGAGSGGSGNVNGSRPFSPVIQCANRLAAQGFLVSTDTVNVDQNNGIDDVSWNGYRPEIHTGVAAGGASTGLASASQNPTIGGVQPLHSSSLNGFSYVASAAYDSIDLWINYVAATGTMIVTVNGATVATIVQGSGPTGTIAKTTISGLSGLAGDTIRILRSSGNTYHPLCIDIYKSTDKAWHLFNAGARNSTISGQVANDWMLTGNANSMRTAITGMGAYYDALAMAIGINDQRVGSRSSATCQANIQAYADDYLAANPAGKLIFVTPNPITSETSWSNATMATIYSNLQAHYGSSVSAWVDTASLCVAAFGTANAVALQAAGYINADGLHPTVGVGGDGGIYRQQGYGLAAALRTLFGV